MHEADRPLPAGAVRPLVELTERALSDGLSVAVEAAVEALRELDGIDRIDLEIDDAGRRALDVLGLDARTVHAALDAAIDAAQRSVAARATDRAGVDELRVQARHDELTGALNRRALLEHLDGALAEGTELTLVLCDLDGLKAINDQHGHPTGDAALRAFVDLATANVRSTDAVGRIGGDEFALLLPGAQPAAVERILGRLTTTVAGGVAEVRASFGTARSPADGTTRDQLVATADRRLYEHKRDQRGARQT